MGVFRVALVAHLNGADEARNIFTFDSGGGGLPSNAEVAAYFDTLFTISTLTAICDDWLTNRFIVEEPNISGHWEYRSEGAYAKQGSNGGDALPQQSAYVLIGVTPSRRRGKKFLAGVPETMQTGGVISAGATSAMQDIADAWIAGMTVGVGTAVAGVCKSDGTDFLAFGSARVDPILGTQRRRKQGRGS